MTWDRLLHTSLVRKPEHQDSRFPPCRPGGIYGLGLWPQAHPLPSASSTGQDHSSPGPQRHLPELPATASRQSAFLAARSGACPLCQASPAHHSWAKWPLTSHRVEPAPTQNFRSTGDQCQCLSQNYGLWTWAESAGLRSLHAWAAAEPIFLGYGTIFWTPKLDTGTPEWNAWILSWSLTPGNKHPKHWNYGHWLSATKPPAWILFSPYPVSSWTSHALLSFAPLAQRLWASPHGSPP